MPQQTSNYLLRILSSLDAKGIEDASQLLDALSAQAGALGYAMRGGLKVPLDPAAAKAAEEAAAAKQKEAEAIKAAEEAKRKETEATKAAEKAAREAEAAQQAEIAALEAELDAEGRAIASKDALIRKVREYDERLAGEHAAAMKKAQEASKKLSDGMVEAGKKLSLFVTTPIMTFGALALKGAAEAEDAEAQLRAALMGHTDALEKDMQTIGAHADALQESIGLSGEMGRQMAATAITMGAPADSMKEILEGAVGLNKVFGLDMPSAVKASTAAFQGNTVALSRYLPAVGDAETETEKLTIAQNAMRSGFAQTLATSDNLSGKAKRLKEVFSDVGEEFGKVLMPLAKGLADVLLGLGKHLAGLSNGWKALITVLAAVAASIGPMVILLGKLVSALRMVSVAMRWVSAQAIGLRAALISTGVGALVVLLGTLAASLSAMGSETADTTGKVNNAKTAVAAFRQELEKIGAGDSATALERLKKKAAEVEKEFETAAARVVVAQKQLANTSAYAKGKGIGGTVKKELDNATAAAILAEDKMKAAQEAVASKSAALAAIEKSRQKELKSILEERAKKEREALLERGTLQERQNAVLERMVTVEGQLSTLRATAGNDASTAIEKLTAEKKINDLLEEQIKLRTSAKTLEAELQKQRDAQKTLELETAILQAQADGDSARTAALQMELALLQKTASISSALGITRAAAAVYANQQLEAETRIADRKVDQARLELSILQAQAAGDDAREKSLQRQLDIEKARDAYIAAGVTSNDEALKLATQQVDANRDLTDRTKRGNLDEQRARAEVAAMRAAGKKDEADEVELRLDAVKASQEYGISLQEAYESLKAIKGLEGKGGQEHGKRGKSVASVEREQQKIEKKVNSKNWDTVESGKKSAAQFEKRYGFKYTESARDNYKGDIKGWKDKPEAGAPSARKIWEEAQKKGKPGAVAPTAPTLTPGAPVKGTPGSNPTATPAVPGAPVAGSPGAIAPATPAMPGAAVPGAPGALTPQQQARGGMLPAATPPATAQPSGDKGGGKKGGDGGVGKAAEEVAGAFDGVGAAITAALGTLASRVSNVEADIKNIKVDK